MQELLELLIDLCARLGRPILRPLWGNRPQGLLFGFACWFLGLLIFLAILAGLLLWIFW
ncbi:hypothetical protein [Falsiroseomonas sp.]|uniref:hypothetical protein n=1 Tax=Falsiroseomonas sp. TaxID=2870721 RepID=UPI003F72442F